MAEVKNSFLQAKMNLDFDDRIIPNGQYREAYNIITGRSEDSDIGALENIPGNILLSNTDLRTSLGNPNIDAIGYLVDSNKNRIIVCLTDWDGELGVPAIASSFCAIYMYTIGATPTYVPLVVGSFLNFSKKNPIYGINIIEDLLFLTDNRNQPRKINVDLAPGGYYTSEVQISVAKYNPYEVISLIKTAKTTVLTTPTTTTFTVANPVGIEVGMTVLGPNINGSNYTFVKTIAGSLITIDMDPTPGSITISDELVFLGSTMTNENSNLAWPGDPDYLKSRYVRFGYRFKFDDGEYSIVSPFTQIAYIPEQKGFFVAGDEDAAFRSTVVNFMQNNVQNIELYVPLPDTYNNIGNSYKITEIDILYKESDQTTIKVLESIVIAQNTLPGDDGDTNVFIYNYQSRKPYKTLPEAQTVRVYDKVPTRALAQETAGNRIIYGNYRDAYTPPLNISYTVGVAPKEIDYTDNGDSFIEYPNHTLKENRNYQVGFILADKYGRQSSVLLSPVTSEADGGFGGSTVYSPYKSASPNMLNWLGDTLIVSVNAPIASGINGQPDFATGEPGLYAAPNANGSLGFAIASGGFTTTAPFQYTFTLSTNPLYAINNIVPVANLTSLRGRDVDYVKVTAITGTGTVLDPYIVTTNGAINSMYNYNASNIPDIKYAYTINEIGWYSYKVVVKQFEQDYYNCYLPGMLNGYPEQSTTLVPLPAAFPSGETNKTAHIVLLNDNINKIPRDLNEVGPDQKQYRSSVLLYGRVENFDGTTNIQYYPGKLFDVASTIANANDLNMTYSSLGSNGQQNLYQIDTQPIIARISTSNVNNPIGVTTTTMRPVLSIYETKPVESLLDIYWETSTVGLISDLNEQALTGFEGPVGFSAFTYSQKEHQDPAGTGTVEGEENSRFVTPAFFITAPGPVPLPTAIVTSFSVKNGEGTDVSAKFSYIQAPSGEIRIRINEAFTYLKGSSTKDVFTFSFGVSLTTPQGILTNTLITVGALENIAPSMSPEPTLFEVAPSEDFVGQLIDTVNGAFTNEEAQIYFVIDSITGPDISPVPFILNPVTGVILQTADSNRVPGIYSLSVTFYDARIADGSFIAGEPLTGVINFDIEIMSTQATISIRNESQSTPTYIFNVTVDGVAVTLDPGYSFPVLPNTTVSGVYTMPISISSSVIIDTNSFDSALSLCVDGFCSCQPTIYTSGYIEFTGLDLSAGPTLAVNLSTEGSACV